MFCLYLHSWSSRTVSNGQGSTETCVLGFAPGLAPNTITSPFPISPRWEGWLFTPWRSPPRSSVGVLAVLCWLQAQVYHKEGKDTVGQRQASVKQWFCKTHCMCYAHEHCVGWFCDVLHLPERYLSSCILLLHQGDLWALGLFCIPKIIFLQTSAIGILLISPEILLLLEPRESQAMVGAPKKLSIHGGCSSVQTGCEALLHHHHWYKSQGLHPWSCWCLGLYEGILWNTNLTLHALRMGLYLFA